MRSFWYVFLFFCGDFLDLLCCFQSCLKKVSAIVTETAYFTVSICFKLRADHAF